MSTEQLSKRIHTTKELRSIISTMKMLSSVSLNTYSKASVGIKQYKKVLEEGFTALLSNGFQSEKKAVQNKSVLFLLIGSDNGLVGGFNKNILQSMQTMIKSHLIEQKFFICIGRRLALYSAQEKQQPVSVFPISNVIDEIANISSYLLSEIQKINQTHQIDKVYLIYNKKEKTHTVIQNELLLPLFSENFTKQPQKNSLQIDMDKSDFFKALAHEYLTIQITKALINSLECEHYIRMINMRQAEKNIDEKISEMALAYSEMRQTEITDELIDIISGAESLKTNQKKVISNQKNTC